MRTNPHAEQTTKISSQILCGADLCGTGQPALPPLLLIQQTQTHIGYKQHTIKQTPTRLKSDK